MNGRHRPGFATLLSVILGLSLQTATVRAQERGPGGTARNGAGVACGVCVEAAATYGTLVGDAFDEDERGLGMEVVLRHTWPTGWGLGLGARISSLGIHAGAREGIDLDIQGLFLEPRFTMVRDEPLRPFVGGRLELLDLDEPARSDGGFLAGLVGGLDYAVSRAVTLTGSLHSSAIFFGGGRKGAGREMRIGVRVKP